MRYVRYESPRTRGWGIVEGDRIRPVRGSPFDTWEAGTGTEPLAEAWLLAPCEPTKIVALGLNYRSHAAEIGIPVPTEPAMFIKPTTAVVGPRQAIVYPKRSSRVDYEAELACVIKTRTHRVSEDQALAHVLGYTCLNDVTARDIQFVGGNFLNLTWAKSYDTFCPIGPWIETDVKPDDLLVECYLNGRRVQSASTSDFIFPMARQIAWVSQIMTLLPGDVLTTGTPAGIGPMQIGDTVEVRISRIGSLENRVVAEL